jgi:hypothetical protein
MRARQDRDGRAGTAVRIAARRPAEKGPDGGAASRRTRAASDNDRGGFFTFEVRGGAARWLVASVAGGEWMDERSMIGEGVGAILRDYDVAPREALENLEDFARMMADAGYFSEARPAFEVLLCAQSARSGAYDASARGTAKELEALGVSREDLYDDLLALGAELISSGRFELARGAALVALRTAKLAVGDRAPDTRGALDLLERSRGRGAA